MDKRFLDFVYPNGAHKAITLRFDDGPAEDRQMVALLNRYGLKATFFLVASHLKKGGRDIQADEVSALYHGHEVANHTFSHEDPRTHELSSEHIEKELANGKEMLETLTDHPVLGYAYVCSTYGNIGADEYKCLLAKTGHKYAIMGRENHCFAPDIHDPFDIGQSFRFRDDMLIPKAEEFCKLEAKELSIMLVMAHTYEFKDQKRGCDWQKVERFCQTVSGRPDIWYATNCDVIIYLLDVYKFMNSESLQNTTESTIYIMKNGQIFTLKPGETLSESL